MEVTPPPNPLPEAERGSLSNGSGVSNKAFAGSGGSSQIGTPPLRFGEGVGGRGYLRYNQRMTFQTAFFLAGLAAVFVGATLGSAEAQAQTAPVLPPAPAGVVITQNVAYLAPNRTEKGDLYLPEKRDKNVRSPGIVIIHGGGWTGGFKSASREFNIGTTLAKAGYVCFSIDYQMRAAGRWPTNVQDCKNAVRFLRAHAAEYHIDSAHIGVIGGSAGGHLALMVGLTDARQAELTPAAPYPGVSDTVQAVVDMYGITDVRTGVKTEKDGTPTTELRSWNAVFGSHAPITEADKSLASPVSHLRPGLPPVLILQGTRDTTVDRNQSIDLDKKMTDANLPHELILVPGIGHTFDLEKWNGKPLPQDLRPVVVGFFDRYLKPTAAIK